MLSKSLIKQKKKLLKEAEILNTSIEWWSNEMDRLVKKFDSLKEGGKAQKLVGDQILALIGKGESEIKNIDSWMIKRNNLIKKISQ